VSTDRQQTRADGRKPEREPKKQIGLSGKAPAKEHIDDGYGGTMLDRPVLFTFEAFSMRLQ
jgi:hypothetical protein